MSDFSSGGPSFDSAPVKGYEKERLPVSGTAVKDANGAMIRTNGPDASGGLKKKKK